MQSETIKSQRKCPGCGAERTVRSRSRFLDGLPAMLGRKPYRCRSCQKRFYVTVQEVKASPAETRRESRNRRRLTRRREITVYLSAAVVVLVAVAVMMAGQL